MSTTSSAVERYQPVMSEAEQSTLLGFLAGYRGYTRDASTLDLRQFTSWCWQRQHRLFDVRRVDIACFAREVEDRGKARATVARRLCTIVGFYRYAEKEGVIEHSPAVHPRRQLRRHIEDMFTDADESLGEHRPIPVAPSTAHVRGSNRVAHCNKRLR